MAHLQLQIKVFPLSPSDHLGLLLPLSPQFLQLLWSDGLAVGDFLIHYNKIAVENARVGVVVADRLELSDVVVKLFELDKGGGTGWLWKKVVTVSGLSIFFSECVK